MLRLCATPIGNMEDITLRVLNALRDADEIWCEDTRHTLQLLNHFSIKKPLVSCHAHNEGERVERLVAALQENREIVYVSDAGMPGISDPGAVLVRACVEHQLPYTVLPGACAAVTAAVLSGLPCDDFTFFGFLPRSGRLRREAIQAVGACGHLAILYESPHRVAETFSDLHDVLGDREAALCRELTKKFETVVRGTLSSLAGTFQAEEPKGECVLLISCPHVEATEETVQKQELTLDALLNELLSGGLSTRDAAQEAAVRLNVKKKVAYQRALELQGGAS